jgi:hypothetical protein
MSLTTKCGVDGGGWVWVWCAAWALDDARVVDELWVDDVEVLVAVDAAEVVVFAVVAVELAAVEADDEADLGGWDVEWLLDPHAATSSAVISAAPMRFTIGSA